MHDEAGLNVTGKEQCTVKQAQSNRKGTMHGQEDLNIIERSDLMCDQITMKQA